jgi:outer membrane protein OmpA-like peptidoglycan-associated protein
MKTASLLLAGTALVALGFHSLPAGAVEPSFIVAQATPKPDAEPGAARRAQQRLERQEQRQKQQAPAVRQQQPAPQTQAPAPQINRSVQQETPRRNDTPPAAAQTEQQRAPAAAQRDDRRQQSQDRDNRRPAAQQQPAQQERTQQSTTPQNERDRNADTQRDRRNQNQADTPRGPQNQNQNADTQRDRRNQNADQQRDRTSPTQTQTGQTPAANERSRQQQAGDADQARPRDSSEFIRRDNTKARTVDDVRRERREERQGDRTVIREGDRTIVREGNRTVIRHNETTRFTIGARGVNVQRVGGETRTVVERPGGVRIVTVTDANGRLLRRVRIVNGREFVLLNNRFRGPNYQVFVMLPPPVIRIPRERYIVNYVVGMPAPVVYETLLAEPVEPIAERYTIEQVRYSEPVRARMPRVDLDLNFETGSWQLTPEQVEKLNVIADGIKRAIERNPQEVFLIEGHTDAVGSDEDNLSLSDRRAEAVAVALTEQYQVPPENLVTQGYGEQNPKVDTQGPSEENRRVSVRRVTPLLAQEQGTTEGGGGQPQ